MLLPFRSTLVHPQFKCGSFFSIVVFCVIFCKPLFASLSQEAASDYPFGIFELGLVGMRVQFIEWWGVFDQIKTKLKHGLTLHLGTGRLNANRSCYSCICFDSKIHMMTPRVLLYTYVCQNTYDCTISTPPVYVCIYIYPAIQNVVDILLLSGADKV